MFDRMRVLFLRLDTPYGRLLKELVQIVFICVFLKSYCINVIFFVFICLYIVLSVRLHPNGQTDKWSRPFVRSDGV